MPSRDLTEFIRSVPIAVQIILTLTDRNETERNERTEPDSYIEMDNSVGYLILPYHTILPQILFNQPINQPTNLNVK